MRNALPAKTDKVVAGYTTMQPPPSPSSVRQLNFLSQASFEREFFWKRKRGGGEKITNSTKVFLSVLLIANPGTWWEDELVGIKTVGWGVSESVFREFSLSSPPSVLGVPTQHFLFFLQIGFFSLAPASSRTHFCESVLQYICPWKKWMPCG